jgi:hypothetical protein
MQNWLEELIEFYNFVWKSGTEACGKCVNEKLMEDFANGGSLFEQMKKKIIERFPTRQSANKAFLSNIKK